MLKTKLKGLQILWFTLALHVAVGLFGLAGAVHFQLEARHVVKTPRDKLSEEKVTSNIQSEHDIEKLRSKALRYHQTQLELADNGRKALQEISKLVWWLCAFPAIFAVLSLRTIQTFRAEQRKSEASTPQPVTTV